LGTRIPRAPESHTTEAAEAYTEVCLRKVRRYAAVVFALAVLPVMGSAAGNSAIAATTETQPALQNYYSPASPQQWSSIDIAIKEAITRKAREKAQARYASLESYLSRYGSPLAPYAKDFVDAGDKYGVDYRVVVAIAGREQTFGVAWPGSSNNFWGYGGYHWPSVSTAIWEYTRMLSQEYPGLSHGDIYGSASRYAASSSWAAGVAEFYGELQRDCS
jgi:hypothetical protein